MSNIGRAVIEYCETHDEEDVSQVPESEVL